MDFGKLTLGNDSNSGAMTNKTRIRRVDEINPATYNKANMTEYPSVTNKA